MIVHNVLPFQLIPFARTILHPHFEVVKHLCKRCRCSVRENVQFTAGDGSEIRVNFEVTDAKRPILLVKKGADTGAMTIFKLYGGKDNPRRCNNPDSYKHSGRN